MKSCAMFGHRDCPAEVALRLEAEMERLIVTGQADYFTMGSQGRFDAMAYAAAKRLKQKYPQIDYDIVLAYLPKGKSALDSLSEPLKTIYPEGLESVPKRFAISRRNRWMVEQADVILCYITHDWGGASKAVEYASRTKMPIYNLAILPFTPYSA